MRFFNLIVISFVCTSMAQSVLGQTTLPKVFSANTPDKTAISIREQAKAASNAISGLYTNESTVTNKDSIRSFIFAQAGVSYCKETPLKLKSTKTIQLGSFRIENIRYQSQPGVYVTASLYVPEGTGPFPAVVNMHGHWPGARRTEIAQTTAQLLAQNGYVCLNVDAWGAGERSANPHMHEYHGSGLDASLLHVGTSLLGQQLTDNIRAVDLLCSLPYVDASNIGATGASGGGNQTMWLAAADSRIKAIVPVVSIGTFESYIMYGYRETAVAVLFHAAITSGKDPLILEECPISYLFDQEANVNFYNMSIYLPGLLVWGEISLAASLTDAPITVIDPRSISGRIPSKQEQILYRKEFEDMGKKTGKENHIKFIYNEIKK